MKTTRGKLVLVTGGARCGKSTFAEKYAAASGKKVLYIATAAAGDAEMRRRIQEHRRRRPPEFVTCEEQLYPHRVVEAEVGADKLYLLDCLTLLLSNHLLQGGEGEEEMAVYEKRAEAFLSYAADLCKLLRDCRAEAVVVTNEVGWGVVPEAPLGRLFRDTAGRANQLAAAAADEVWLLVCGIPQLIKRSGDRPEKA